MQKNKIKIYILLGAFILLPIWEILNYYFIPYFIVAFAWLLIVFALFVWLFIEVCQLINERSKLSKQKVVSVCLILVLFLLIFFRPLNKIIEKADWQLFYDKRMEVIRKIKSQELKPNVGWNNWICELPYEYPILSNGGNDIGIYQNDSTNELTVTFWIFRNIFSAPSSHFVYTNTADKIDRINRLIKEHPKHNWKVEENWYRTFHE